MGASLTSAPGRSSAAPRRRLSAHSTSLRGMASKRLALAAAVVSLTACSSSPGAPPVAHAGTPTPAGSAAASPTPSPVYPPYYIEGLRSQTFDGGAITVGDRMVR